MTLYTEAGQAAEEIDNDEAYLRAASLQAPRSGTQQTHSRCARPLSRCSILSRLFWGLLAEHSHRTIPRRRIQSATETGSSYRIAAAGFRGRRRLVMSTRKPRNSQPIKSLDELKPFLWIARYYNPHNINNRREQIRAIVDDKYIVQTQTGRYAVVDPYEYQLMID